MDEKYCLYPCAHFVSNTLNWAFKKLLYCTLLRFKTGNRIYEIVKFPMSKPEDYGI